MKKVAILGIDLAKNVFQLHGVDSQGQTVLKRRVRRERLLRVVAEMDPCLIVVEACTGAFYWARTFQQFGHSVRVISPQYVKPFVKGTRTTATMRKLSVRRCSDRTCASFPSAPWNNRMCKRCTARGNVWSTIG